MAPRKKVANLARGRNSLRLKGHVGPFLDLPLDILLEILKLAQPLDLLYLCRTNKALRGFLLDRGNISIWRLCLELAEDSPPPCPSFSCEVEWTRLIYESVCHVCLSPLEHDFLFDPIWWEFGGRYCDECCPNQVVERLPKILTKDHASRKWLDIFPRAHGFYLKKDIDTFIAKYSTVETEEDKAKLIQERRDQTKVILDHVRISKPWMNRLVKARTDVVEELKDSRWNAITAKLRQAGWPYKLIRRTNWMNDDLVYIPRRLSDAEWKEIEPKLVKKLENSVRDSVVADRFRNLRWAFSTYELENLTNHLAFAPRVMEIALFPEVRAILEGDIKLEMEPSDLKAAIEPKLPKLLEAWSRTFEMQLRDYTRTALNLPSDSTVDPFKQALAYFVCDNRCCYGHFTGHWKLCSQARGYSSDEPEPETYEEQAERSLCCTPCTPNIMFSLEPARAILEDVIRRFGKDPQTATCEEMDAAPGKLWCMRCVLKNQPTGWRDAPAHNIKFHAKVSSLRPRWEVDLEPEN
ncbi:hypothetical protein C8F04DRAFT_449351 [Mycena alexandri]|uniref:F-box domain-containing protein n=1 Tax=Mycena alexandri TaxID=1745969 RepID=A0AAD6THJ5_9AGAR|nr:hypothetical protein C8F04DRAFT_449351 [Mycena alexandri]